MLGALFHTNRKLAEALWREYPASQTLGFQLRVCARHTRTPTDTRARIKHLSDLIDPKQLLRAVDRLVDPGKPRPRDIREFEQRVLHILDRSGQWRWS
jgi:hypothetical protein